MLLWQNYILPEGKKACLVDLSEVNLLLKLLVRTRVYCKFFR